MFNLSKDIKILLAKISVDSNTVICLFFVQARLKSLEEELEEEEITLKGFWKKKWTLLEHLLTKEQVID
jgi:hypothetical protein